MTQRVRTIGAFGSYVYSVKDWAEPATEPAWTNYTSGSTAEGTVKIMTDYTTPGFRKLSAGGSIVNNPMDIVTETRQSGKGTLFWVNLNANTPAPKYNHHVEKDFAYGGYSAGMGPIARALPGYDSLLTEVRTRALANVARPDYSGIVSLGELKETLGYLKNPLKTGLKLAETLEKRVGSLFKKHSLYKPRRGTLHRDDMAIVKELESLYFEFRYGVRPAISDATAFLENLRDRVTERPKRQTFRARNLRNDRLDWSTVDQVVAGGSYMLDATFEWTRNISFSAGLLYEFTTRSELSQKWGMDLAYLPSAAWALAPCSFVADWFANTGQFVSALTPISGANQLSSWETLKVEEVMTRTASRIRLNNAYWPGVLPSGSRSQDVHTLVTYHRVPRIGLPGIVFKATALDTFSDLAKVADLAFLAHQRLGNASAQARSLISQTRAGRAHPPSSWFG